MKNIVIWILTKLAHEEDGVIGDVVFHPTGIEFRLNTFRYIHSETGRYVHSETGDFVCNFKYTYLEYIKNTIILWWKILRTNFSNN